MEITFSLVLISRRFQLSSIYAVIVVRTINDVRILGFHDNFDDAENAVIKNTGDMSENGYYPYAIIEEINLGSYGVTFNKKYYNYDKKHMEFIPVTEEDVAHDNIDVLRSTYIFG